jgi:hypothetical protein
MSGEPTLYDVASILGLRLPEVNRRGDCPFRAHKRKRNFAIFRSKKTGDLLYKCWSCDPPGNVGDAVGMYARQTGVDRREAIKQLKEYGYSFGRRCQRPQPQAKQPVAPLRGTIERAVLPLDLVRWGQWSEQDLGACRRLAEERSLSLDVLKACDVVDIDRDVVGFVYREPRTGIPCRAKCRALGRKAFWVEPRGGNGTDAKALAPLYLAHQLDAPRGTTSPAAITEGEIDALTLRTMEFGNVVSLPDGSESAKTVSLEPLARFRLWLVAVDDDQEGAKAMQVLQRRAQGHGVHVVRVFFRRLEDLEHGEELVKYKDANEALQSGGFAREDFEHCFAVSQRGYRTPVMP